MGQILYTEKPGMLITWPETLLSELLCRFLSKTTSDSCITIKAGIKAGGKCDRVL